MPFSVRVVENIFIAEKVNEQKTFLLVNRLAFASCFSIV